MNSNSEYNNRPPNVVKFQTNVAQECLPRPGNMPRQADRSRNNGTGQQKTENIAYTGQ
jgi:hypothetical protein